MIELLVVVFAMSHMARAALKRPCMDYKASFEHSKLERVKLLQSYADGSTKTKKCPCFSGEHGIECLLYVEDHFHNIDRQFWTIPQGVNSLTILRKS